jgi:zinc transporter ZupT
MGLLIFILGFFHNFIDGFALGVAFMGGDEALAISTLVAIVAHEIPHVIIKKFSIYFIYFNEIN